MKKKAIIAVLALLVLLGLGWFVVEKRGKENVSSNISVPRTDAMQTYRNEEYRFSFSYLQNIKVGNIFTEENKPKYQNYSPAWVFQMILAPGLGESGAMLLIERTKKKSVEEITEDELQKLIIFSSTKTVVRKESIMIGGKPAIEMTLTDKDPRIQNLLEYRQFIVVHNEKIYSFFAMDWIYFGIRSTFTFLP